MRKRYVAFLRGDKPAAMERALGVPIVTFRSISTLGKLAAKYPPG